MSDEILTPRRLNRILLARQMLLERRSIGPVQAVARLFAIQAQLPRAAHMGLWSRLVGFQRQHLLDAIHARTIVRSTLMRGTLHLATADDILAFRTTIMPSRDMTLPQGVRPTPEAIDRVLALAGAHFARPQDFESVRRVLEAEGIEHVRPMAWGARVWLPLVQPSVDNAFGHEPGGEFTLVKTWLGRDEDPTPKPDALALRYLAAHGPSLPADFAGWSGLKGAAAVLESLREALVTFKDVRGRTLYDIRDGERPSSDTHAPVRLLADFDGAIMGRTERTGIVAAEHMPLIASRNGLIPAMVLVDGVAVGTWRQEASKKTCRLSIRAFDAIAASTRKAVEVEAHAMAAFLAPDTATEVVFKPA